MLLKFCAMPYAATSIERALNLWKLVLDTSLCAGGVMVLLHGRVDLSNIRMMGRWHSDAMLRYFHVQAQPILGNYAARMFNEGNNSFLPDETRPSQSSTSTMMIFDPRTLGSSHPPTHPNTSGRWSQMLVHTIPKHIVQYPGGKQHPL
jgi:hypothetical protein